jgi:S1-C subfamily serine protease
MDCWMNAIVVKLRMMNCAQKSKDRVVCGLHAVLIFGLGMLICLPERICLGQDRADDKRPAAGDVRPLSAAAARARKRVLDSAVASDDWTFRPTVLVRRGVSQGTGTIIASLDGETLVLTAAHVIRGRGSIIVELHRYNLGLEQQPSSPGQWPRKATAETVATDAHADLAVLRVRDMIALPFVARLGPRDAQPASSAGLTSVGIDLGSKLSSWNTRVVEVLWFELNDSGTDRPFLVTERIPEHGRSGGGVYDRNGTLLGVCVGHAELVKGKRMGVFSSIENVHQLLTDNDLASVIDRSDARHARRFESVDTEKSRLTRPRRSVVTQTEATHPPSIP